MLVGMSQERLGELLGLTFQQVQKYEKGVNRIGAGRLYEISAILGVPISFFYEDLEGSASDAIAELGGSTKPAPVMEFMSSGEGIQLSLAFMRVTDVKVRRKILDLVRSLADESQSETT
jgi:transcriptional regulator with XRE-family HTH domain